jgi:DNA polymerase gamma 1
VIVAHNVSFDRARIKEQYWLKCSKTRFVDTMSMHVCVSGVSSFQKCQLAKKATPADELLAMDLEEGEMWREKSSLNNLNDVHKLYCDGVGLDKSTRDLFITGNLTTVSNHFQVSFKFY